MSNIFDFEDRDLVNLQRWYKKKPKQMANATRNMLNTVAARTKLEAVEIIKSKTTTRAASFVKNSLRVTKAKGSSLNKLEAQTFSFDISKDGRSEGFESLEVGGKSKTKSVPSLASRGGGSGNKTSKVARGVRWDKKRGMLQPRHFRKFSKTYKGRVGAMLRLAKSRNDKTPMFIPRKVQGSGIIPGVWKQKTKTNLSLMNPIDGKRKSTKAIHWMDKAVKITTSRQALKILWGKEIDRLLKRK